MVCLAMSTSSTPQAKTLHLQYTALRGGGALATRESTALADLLACPHVLQHATPLREREGWGAGRRERPGGMRGSASASAFHLSPGSPPRSRYLAQLPSPRLGGPLGFASWAGSPLTTPDNCSAAETSLLI